MSSMIHKIFALLRLSFVRDSSYRTNFWATIIAKVGFLLITVAWFNIIYATLIHVRGWDYGKTLFFLATFQIIETSTLALFGTSFGEWHRHIKNGSLDTFLVKPMDNQLLLSLQAISLPGLITIAAPVVLLIIVQLNFHPLTGILWFCLYGVAVLLGISIFYSVWLMLMTALFWLEGIEHWSNLFQALTSFMQVPPVIYVGPIKIFFYYIAPLFAAAILPIEVGGTQSLHAFVVLLITSICSLVVSRLLFQYGLRRYGSASS